MVFLRKALIGINLFAGLGTLVYCQVNEIFKERETLNTVESHLIKNELVPLSTQIALHAKDDFGYWAWKINNESFNPREFGESLELINSWKRECKKLLRSRMTEDKHKYLEASRKCVRKVLPS